MDKLTQRRLLDAEILDLVAEMQRDQVASQAGYPSLPAYLTEATRLSRRETSRMVAQAAQVTETVTPTGHVTPAPLPSMRQALRDGVIDGEHIDAVTQVLTQLPEDTSVQNRELVESTLAVTARTSEPRVVREHGRILLDRLNPDGPTPTDEPTPDRNSLRYQRTRDGGMRFAGRIARESADTLEALLGPVAKPTADDTRPADERYGDALCAVIDLAAKSEQRPSQGGEKPNLTVFVDFNALLEGTGLATTEGGAVLCPQAVRRIACDADVIPIVLNGDSVPLDLGRAHRLVSPKLRTALIARDQGCAFPGCHLRARWCDAHHIHHWLHGGATDQDNLVLLCRRHHKVVHESDWAIEVINRLPWFRPPRWVDPDQKLVRNILHHPRQ
ncbi:MAG TPA: DUF222 domain-containing protein [Actinophytocola sp.]|nr:DUF222 domain-containing protein [Actinophytocola sp.]